MDTALSVSNGLTGYFIEDLAVGMTAAFAKTITEADIVLFAGVSGDVNPVHLNEEYAARTMFKGRIAHGMLLAGFLSAVMGNRLPGPGAVYLAQNLRFKAPVRAGDTVTARVTVTELFPERRRVAVRTECLVGDKVVLDGDALLMVPSRG